MPKRFTALFLMMTLLILAGAGCATQQQTATPAASTEIATDSAAEQTGDSAVAADTTTAPTEIVMLELTLEELAEYNGKDGKPAYVAVEGVIYDVTDNPKWTNGTHNGNSAGQDLTEALTKRSPHGTSVLSKVPVVGKIVE